jgi:hypothetical protein
MAAVSTMPVAVRLFLTVQWLVFVPLVLFLYFRVAIVTGPPKVTGARLLCYSLVLLGFFALLFYGLGLKTSFSLPNKVDRGTTFFTALLQHRLGLGALGSLMYLAMALLLCLPARVLVFVMRPNGGLE